MSQEWYEQLREKYRPSAVRYLLVGESPPDSADNRRRFFYSEKLTVDNLYRSVAIAVLGDAVDLANKPVVLAAIMDRGFWLIDAVDYPINQLLPVKRREILRAAAPDLAARCKAIAPTHGVIICHGGVYRAVAPLLKKAAVRVLQSNPLPFPLGNWRARFVAGVRTCVAP